MNATMYTILMAVLIGLIIVDHFNKTCDGLHRPALKKVEELPIRLVEYLKKLALIDRNNELTAKGQEFMNTALLPILERGLYHIWFAENDQLLLKNLLGSNQEGKMIALPLILRQNVVNSFLFLCSFLFLESFQGHSLFFVLNAVPLQAYSVIEAF